jgi:hypothetical protein
MGRRLASIPRLASGQGDGLASPLESFVVDRQRFPQPDLSIRVPGPSNSPTLSTLVVPSSRGVKRKDRPLVLTTNEPPDAETAPATTRSPFPTAPRVGRRRSFEDLRGRLMENSSAISSSVPSMPSPSSSTQKPLSSNRPTRHAAPASRALSASSLATRFGSFSVGTPAF